ncbi:MAG: protein kinase, partial [Ktedonobacteraceae bacterium]|nr:protein kinase [Ktedonobacteraceae bacterium]
HPHGSLLPLNLVVSYAKQIADALQHAHTHRLIHRDIKPENMLVGQHNDILLSDFGIAVMAHGTRSQQTQDIIGSVNYMAPEQIKAHPVLASDQYALGIIVYEWLCGSLPFKGTATEIAIKHLSLPPPALRSINPTIPPLVEQAVLKALEKEPSNRFTNIKAFANALENASLLHAVPTSPALPVQQQSPLLPTFPASYLPQRGTQLIISQPTIGTVAFIYTGHSSTVNSLAWSPNNTRLVSGSSDKTVHAWDATSGQNINKLLHSASVSTVAWSPDGKLRASGSWDQTIQVWNGRKLSTYRMHSNVIRTIAWSPDSKYIASASANDTIHIWTPHPWISVKGIFDPDKHGSHDVWSVAWSPDGKRFAFGVPNHMVVEDRQSLKHIFRCHGYKHIAWSPDGTLLASADTNSLFISDAANGMAIFTYRISKIHAVTWSPYSKLIAFANDDGRVHVCHATTGKVSFVYQGHTGIVKTVAWSPDGKYIASGAEDNTVHVWVAPQ